MFATASRSNVSQHQAGVYRQVHVSSGVMGASPHGLIGMLFDGLLGALAEARGAIRSRNIAAKGKAIGRAVRILDEGLSAALDLEQGGTLAADLRALYGYVALRLTHANLHNDEAALEECVHLIEPLRSGWAAIADHPGT
ncbi:MAG TPA: flagellar export chaperone FliS [Burkholderiaceae bacterium]|nr:flagellar export chaperone FliS [Burkholderiaceae bacterium]